LIYHVAACPIVKRYSLTEVAYEKIDSDSLACEECRPSSAAPLVFPEKHRYWAQVSDDPDAVLEALYKHDQGGARYLTKVAKRLLENAAEIDSGVESVYRVEMIP
jgi:hypothetical protein